jgi:hypothetical protein
MNVYWDNAVDESPCTGDRPPESQNTDSEQQELLTDSSIILLLEQLTNKLDASLLAQGTLENRFDTFVINSATTSIGDIPPGRDARPAAAARPMTAPWHGFSSRNNNVQHALQEEARRSSSYVCDESRHGDVRNLGHDIPVTPNITNW